jgi:3-deoxy-7-phosphoheptulonate synthase
MVIVMREGASKKDIDDLVALLHDVGAETHISQGEYRTVIGVIGDRERVMQMPLEAYAGVEKVVPIMKPYKLVSREFHEEPTIIQIRDVTVGGGNFSIIAGPCSVESEEQVMQAARAAKAGGAEMLRGGAFKPRSSPYSFQGLAEEGLKMLAAARDETGLPVVTEVLDVRDIELVSSYADVLQVGARNMQNFLMLRELGYCDMPILLKRGMSATIEEWLMAAEYILKEGNRKVMLCERGIRTFETATRNTLDISSIPIVKGLSHLPIFVDPSHATGVRELVPPLCRAALAAGADGVMVEIHPNPRAALCDGSQSLTTESFAEMMQDLRGLAEYMGRK